MIRIHPRKILVALIVIDLLFIVLYVVSSLTGKLEVEFDLGGTSGAPMAGEGNVPTWYAGMKLLLIALPCAVLACQKRVRDRASNWLFYVAAALGCVFLSADEVGQIHESIRAIAREHLGGGRSAGLVVGIALIGCALLVGIVLFKHSLAFLREPRGRWAILIGAGMIVGGGVFVDELLQSNDATWQLIEHAIEEMFELVGASLVLYGFLTKLDDVQIAVEQR